MTLGEMIKAYRTEHDMSQQAFADLTGLSKAYISILERNFNPVNKKPPVPSVDTIKTVSIALGRDFNSIIAELDPDTTVSVSVQPADSLKTIDDNDLKAAFYADFTEELSPSDLDELWEDAKEYAMFKAQQRMKRKD